MKALGSNLTLRIALLTLPFSAHALDDDKLDAVEKLSKTDEQLQKGTE